MNDMIPIEIIKNRLGLPVLPSFCTYLITWRCNCRCKMCTIWKKAKGEELTLEEITNIFKQRRFDAIRITGGEPFVREDLIQVANTIQKYSKPKVLHITSNGILTDRIINFFREIEKTDNVHIKISIDAVGEKHDQIRGVRGAYQSAMKTVQELVKMREKLHFYLGINQVLLSEDGLKDHWQLKRIFDSLEVPINLGLAYKSVALYDEKKNANTMPKSDIEFPCYFNLSKQKTLKILNAMKKTVDSLPNFKERLVLKYDLKGFYNRLLSKKAIPNPPCLALRSHLRILPNGDVPICLANSTIVGNLRKTPLKELWFSEKMKKYRQIVKNCPGCWYECETVPSAIYSGDIIRALFY